MRSLKFIKMEGAGNDYVYFDCISHPELEKEFDGASDLVRWIADRHFGVGADGIVLMLPGKNGSQAMMRMWNADGSESSMCGNALRCVAYLVHRNTKQTSFKLETKSGTHQADVVLSSAISGTLRVEIGPARLETRSIPFLPEKAGLADAPGPWIRVPISAGGETYNCTLVSMGNPHCVIFCDDPGRIQLDVVGPLLERHAAFPEKTNVEFVSILADGALRQRTWERGSGETLACGSGVCAVLAASVLEKNMPRKNVVHLKGGELIADWSDEKSIYLSGPARIVFEGTVTI